VAGKLASGGAELAMAAFIVMPRTVTKSEPPMAQAQRVIHLETPARTHHLQAA
jgi:hypothetical protein